MTFATFDDYQRSLPCLLLIGWPERERLEDAYRAGSGGKALPPDMQGPNGDYLYDRLERAFEWGRQDR